MSVALSIELEISVLWSLTNLSEQSDLRSCEFRLIFFNTNIKCSRPLYYTLLIMQKNLFTCYYALALKVVCWTIITVTLLLKVHDDIKNAVK